MSGGGKNVFRIAACLVRPRGRDKSAGLQSGLVFPDISRKYPAWRVSLEGVALSCFVPPDHAHPVYQHAAAAERDGDGGGGEHAAIPVARVDDQAAQQRAQHAAGVKGRHHYIGVDGAGGGRGAIVHGGPFANIAHGCNSVMATQTALALADFVVTEAGFGADLGAEKFLDIKCRMAGLTPSAVVVVATVRALKNHGGVPKDQLNTENLEALEKGLPNLLQHVENITKVFGLPCVVALNAFATDTEVELKLVEERCRALGVRVALCQVWAKGGEGGVELAEEVVRLCQQPGNFQFSYDEKTSIEEKLNTIARRIYHADGVDLTPAARKQMQELTSLGFGELPICMAKTQYSFSDDAARLGAPRDFRITVRNLKVSAGAGFLVALTGNIMTMPGLPKVPAAEKIDVDENGVISGLF